jgi:hypothetical protein
MIGRCICTLVSTLLSVAAFAQSQEQPKPPISEVTVSVVGEARGLESYVNGLKNEITRGWIKHWPTDTPEPSKLTFTLKVNHAGYLNLIYASDNDFIPTTAATHSQGFEQLANGNPARSRLREEMFSAATKATEEVFTGLPPEPPALNYAQPQIVLKVSFLYGPEKPRL